MSDGDFQVDRAVGMTEEAYAEMINYKKPEWSKLLSDLIKRTDNILKELKTINMTGIEKIAQKRLEQKVKHGYSIKSDYEAYPDFELMQAAQAILEGNKDNMPESWDKNSCERLCSKSLEDRLITAGAMLAAQIDILNFKE